MPKQLSPEKIAKLKELASRDILYNEKEVTTKTLMDHEIFTLEDAYNKGVEDGESFLSKFILQSIREPI
jgi:hypothetical protein